MAKNAIPAQNNGSTIGSLIYNPKFRSYSFQIVALISFILLVILIGNNVASNLARSNTASGFGFLHGRSGFDIGDTLIDYSSNSTYGRAILVGFLNTILVAVIGIITATIIGFIVGIGRLSKNWLIAKISTIYVELFRNIPPLLVIFFWYSGVLRALPGVREALELPFSIFLSNRGLTFPKPIWAEGAFLIVVSLLVAIIAAIVINKVATKRQMLTGQRAPVLSINLLLIFGLPLATFFALGSPLSFDVPVAGRFNLSGGATILPEFFALYLALSFYTAAFIAEIIRSGIKGVPHGQTEAATALGISPRQTTRFVVVPQALRIIIPPLTSQYLNLIKNSSLGVAIGYPELVSTGGTTLNQTGQAIEVVAIWMIVYLSISLATSIFMNWFNARMALVER